MGNDDRLGVCTLAPKLCVQLKSEVQDVDLSTTIAARRFSWSRLDGNETDAQGRRSASEEEGEEAE